jgi:hypothetical protein
MAADASDQTTAAKTESASQSMYRGAGKETVNVYAGNIVQIGRRSDGSRNVVFQSTSSTFDTQWPKWAYQIAMAAYLYDKQIQVIADGQPDGDKLRSVNLILPMMHPAATSGMPGLEPPDTWLAGATSHLCSVPGGRRAGPAVRPRWQRPGRRRGRSG